MDQEKIFQIALSMVPGIGNITAKTLISYCGSASEVFKRNKHKLSNIPGIGSFTADTILNFKDFAKAEKEIARYDDKNIQILFYTDKEYPKRLKHAPDAPIILFWKGNANLNAIKTVSIVGTRNATSYGKNIVETLIEGLIPHNCLIISGLAYGIDIHAHKIALKHNLPTIGVMASGIDTIYPSAHKEIALEMQKNGGLITENRLGIKPEAHQFPARNRIIAGMSDAVIVVEAAEKGGALITAEIANSYNIDVFAIPGEIGKKYSAGCNNLIKKNKAHLLTGVKDLEYIMNWESEGQNTLSFKKHIDYDLLNEDERLIISTIEKNNSEILIDDLSWKSQIPLNKLASSLLNLEIKGMVKPLPGKKYRIN